MLVIVVYTVSCTVQEPNVELKKFSRCIYFLTHSPNDHCVNIWDSDGLGDMPTPSSTGVSPDSYKLLDAAVNLI